MRAVLTMVSIALVLAGPALAGGGMSVTSPAFQPGGPMPRSFVEISPPLRWTQVRGARSYAVIMRDPDAPTARPFTHWLAWNIPGSAAGLPQGGLPGIVQGVNDTGRPGYVGPHPPSGVHHYHIEVLALDTPLALPAGADLPALTAAIRGHVLAAGELVGTFSH